MLWWWIGTGGRRQAGGGGLHFMELSKGNFLRVVVEEETKPELNTKIIQKKHLQVALNRIFCTVKKC